MLLDKLEKKYEKTFRQGDILLINADCMEVMQDIDKVDLAIVDPPYGIKADAKNSANRKQSSKSATYSKNYGSQLWDNKVPDEDYFERLFMKSRNQIIWGVNYYPYSCLAGGRIYWDKCVTMPTYSDGELAYCSKINSIKSVKLAWHGMIQSDMKNKEQRIHPTQKPVKLYQWLLDNYAEKGQTILDTHLGSASSAIAAHYFGVKFIGVELDADYFDAACKRFEQMTRQVSLL